MYTLWPQTYAYFRFIFLRKDMEYITCENIIKGLSQVQRRILYKKMLIRILSKPVEHSPTKQEKLWVWLKLEMCVIWGLAYLSSQSQSVIRHWIFFWPQNFQIISHGMDGAVTYIVGKNNPYWWNHEFLKYWLEVIKT